MKVVAFYTAMTAWLSLKGQDYKLSEVLKVFRREGLHQYVACIIPPHYFVMNDPEAFDRIFRDGSPEGFVLEEVATAEVYSEQGQTWRIQLTYVSEEYIRQHMGHGVHANISGVRRYHDSPHVEVGPGAFKSELMTYPPKFLQVNLNKLLTLKQQREEREKNLNPEE